MQNNKNVIIKSLGKLVGTSSQLKVGDHVLAYKGHDGTGKPCTRIVECQGMNTFHWVVDDADLV